MAGAINYPGELMLHAEYGRCGEVRTVRIRNRNHSAMALRSLSKSHGPILEHFPLRYGGRSGDGFLEFFDRERARVAKQTIHEPEAAQAATGGPNGEAVGSTSAPSTMATNPEPPIRGQAAALLYDESGVDLVTVSPSGRWVAARGKKEDLQGLMIQRVGLGVVEIAPQFRHVDALVWEGPDELLVRGGRGVNGFENRYFLVTPSVVDGRIRIQAESLAAYGGLVDSRPQDVGVVVWEYEYRGRNSVHRVKLSDLANAPDVVGRIVRNGDTLAVIEGSAHAWILDRSGMPRAALRRDDHGYSILWRKSERQPFRVVYRYDDAPVFAFEGTLSMPKHGERRIPGTLSGVVSGPAVLIPVS